MSADHVLLQRIFLLLAFWATGTYANAENIFESTLPTNENIIFVSPLQNLPSLQDCDIQTEFHRVREGIHHYIVSRTQVRCVDSSYDLFANFGYTGPRDARYGLRLYENPRLVGEFRPIAVFHGALAAQALDLAAEMSNAYLDYYGRSRWLLYPRFMLLTPLLGRPCYNTANQIESRLRALSQDQ